MAAEPEVVPDGDAVAHEPRPVQVRGGVSARRGEEDDGEGRGEREHGCAQQLSEVRVRSRAGNRLMRGGAACGPDGTPGARAGGGARLRVPGARGAAVDRGRSGRRPRSRSARTTSGAVGLLVPDAGPTTSERRARGALSLPGRGVELACGPSVGSALIGCRGPAPIAWSIRCRAAVTSANDRRYPLVLRAPPASSLHVDAHLRPRRHRRHRARTGAGGCGRRPAAT